VQDVHTDHTSSLLYW